MFISFFNSFLFTHFIHYCCLYILFTTFVPYLFDSLCSQFLSITITFVNNLWSKLLLTTVVHNFCSYHLFTTLVHNFCSQLMLRKFVHNLCFAFVFNSNSQLLFSTFVHNKFGSQFFFFSKVLFTTFVLNFCSQLLFEKFIHNFCSQFFFQQILLKAHVHNFIHNCVHNFC